VAVVTALLLFTIPLVQSTAVAADSSTGTLRGSITAVGASDQTYNITGATVTLTGGMPGAAPLSILSNDSGEYKFAELDPGLYTLEITLAGFKKVSRKVAIRTSEITVEDVRLEIEDLKSNVTVQADSEGINKKDAAPAAQITQQNLQTLPLANERFEDALPLIPGVVRGPDGLINVKGARASQSGLTVNSANVTDPVTGEYAINLPVEAIQSVQVLTNPYAPEYGAFSGAVTTIETKSGTDKFDQDFQNFFPRFRRRGGHFVGIEAFTPRLSFSGPLKKDKLWFMQSFEYRFVRTPVENLPPLKRDTGLESFDSVLQLDWESSETNHVTTTFSLFPQKLRFVGLNTFNPQEVTPNFKQRGFFWAVNDRKLLGNKAVLESLFSIKRFDADVFPSSGSAPMNLAPDANSGNFFNRQQRRSARYEALEVYSFTPPSFLGTHFMKAAAGFTIDNYDGSNTSSVVRILRADGTRSRQIDFVGSGAIDESEHQFLGFIQDKWAVNNRLNLEYGIRYDRDNIASANNFAPRIAFSFMPVPDGHTVVRGGVGLFYGQVDLNVATFTQLQDRILTRYAADGQTIISGPQKRLFVLQDGRFLTPRSLNWNLEVDREWLKNLMVRVGYQQRESRREFIVNPLASAPDSLLLLTNGGRSRYRELQLLTRFRFGKGNDLVASYTRSSTTGDLNDFNTFFGNFGNPTIRRDERSLLPYDSPNRFLFWGEFNVKYGLTVAPVLDIRNGFPYSVIDADRNFVGPRNLAGRFPTFISLDTQILKAVSFPGKLEKYRTRVGLKVFNVTNHFNPRDFQNNIDSSSFASFSNGVGRMFALKFVIEKK
jgi:hypothetical protein